MSMRDTHALEKFVYLSIVPNVASDYARRNVFPEFRTDEGQGGYYKVPRKTAKAVMEDALEQKWIKRPREDRGVAVSYGMMRKSIVCALGLQLNVHSKDCHAFKCDLDLHGAAEVQALLTRLGIPFVETLGDCDDRKKSG